MLVASAYILIGFIFLYYGADWLVGGSVRLAHKHQISPLVVGLTIVAVGTSAPELVVSLLAAIEGDGDISIGNIVGSNIANICLILGMASLILPLEVTPRTLRNEMPITLCASGLLWLLARDGEINRRDGIIFLLCYAGFMIYCLRTAKAPEGAGEEIPKGIKPWQAIALGGVGLVVGAQLLVSGAVNVAEYLGVSKLVIGLTVVAVGTSIPEMATSMVASFRKHHDISVGNVVGSNISNILLVLALCAIVQPIAVTPNALSVDIPIMILLTAVALPFMITGHKISRAEGALLLLSYVLYLAYLFSRNRMVM